MKKTTKEQIKERNELCALALEANAKKAKGVMRDFDGGRCCLCVARDVAIENGLELSDNVPNQTPEIEVVDWFGWDDVNPMLIDPLTSEVMEAAVFNDGDSAVGVKERTHKEIAAMFRHTFCK